MIRDTTTDPSCFQMEYLLLAVTVSSLARLGEALDNVSRIIVASQASVFTLLLSAGSGQNPSHGMAGLGEVQVQHGL